MGFLARNGHELSWYTRYWTGTSLFGGDMINFSCYPGISLNFKLVPVQYRECVVSNERLTWFPPIPWQVYSPTRSTLAPFSPSVSTQRDELGFRIWNREALVGYNMVHGYVINYCHKLSATMIIVLSSLIAFYRYQMPVCRPLQWNYSWILILKRTFCRFQTAHLFRWSLQPLIKRGGFCKR